MSIFDRIYSFKKKAGHFFVGFAHESNQILILCELNFDALARAIRNVYAKVWSFFRVPNAFEHINSQKLVELYLYIYIYKDYIYINEPITTNLARQSTTMEWSRAHRRRRKKSPLIKGKREIARNTFLITKFKTSLIQRFAAIALWIS